MVAMNSPTPIRPSTMRMGFRLKNMTRKKAKKPAPSMSSSLLREILPVMAAPIMRPQKMTSHSRLFIIWDQLALSTPVS